MADVGAGGGRAEEEFGADLVVAQALCDQGQDRTFAFGQYGESVLPVLGGRALGGDR